MIYSSIILIDLFNAQQTFYTADVTCIDTFGATQLTLTLGRHFGEDVALESMLVLETGAGFLEAL